MSWVWSERSGRMIASASTPEAARYTVRKVGSTPTTFSSCLRNASAATLSVSPDPACMMMWSVSTP